jgi:hypothetical protein
MRLTPRAARIAALTVATAAAATTIATAADELPQPTSCAGVTVNDPGGDAHATTGGGGVGPGQDNLDLLRTFLRYAPDANGKNVLTVNMEVTNLDVKLPTGAQSIAWNFNFTHNGETKYVEARVGSDGVPLFTYGLRGSPSTKEGDTTGKLFLGAKGIVQVVVPVGALAMEGKTITETYTTAGYVQGAGVTATIFQDRGPDGTAFGKNYKVTPCAEAGATTPVSGDGSAGTTPQQPGGSTPGTTPPPSGPATLDLKVTAPKLSARKLKKARRFSVRLQAGEKVTGLTAKLRKGSRSVGSGRLASVGPGAGKLTIKLTRKVAKKLKKGTYRLTLRGTKADGRTASGAVAVRVGR